MQLIKYKMFNLCIVPKREEFTQYIFIFRINYVIEPKSDNLLKNFEEGLNKRFTILRIDSALGAHLNTFQIIPRIIKL